jgi:hypothetical protein
MPRGHGRPPPLLRAPAGNRQRPQQRHTCSPPLRSPDRRELTSRWSMPSRGLSPPCAAGGRAGIALTTGRRYEPDDRRIERVASWQVARPTNRQPLTQQVVGEGRGRLAARKMRPRARGLRPARHSRLRRPKIRPEPQPPNTAARPRTQIKKGFTPPAASPPPWRRAPWWRCVSAGRWGRT